MLRKMRFLGRKDASLNDEPLLEFIKWRRRFC
jgi:hypothetical protein